MDTVGAALEEAWPAGAIVRGARIPGHEADNSASDGELPGKGKRVGTASLLGWHELMVSTTQD